MALHRALWLVAGATLFLTGPAQANPKSDDPCEHACLAVLKACEKLCNDPATKNDEACDTPCLKQTEACEKECPKMVERAKSGSVNKDKTKLKKPANDAFAPTVNIDH